MLTDGQLNIMANLLIDDEDFRGQPYDDATGLPIKAPVGNVTIGIGQNTDSNPMPYEIGIEWCKHTICGINNDLEKNFDFYLQLDMVRKYILINMHFNLGGRFDQFIKFLSAVKVGDWSTAESEMINSKAAKQCPKRYQKLAKGIVLGVLPNT